jgi:hypothetical protein
MDKLMDFLTKLSYSKPFAGSPHDTDDPQEEIEEEYEEYWDEIED